MTELLRVSYSIIHGNFHVTISGRELRIVLQNNNDSFSFLGNRYEDYIELSLSGITQEIPSSQLISWKWTIVKMFVMGFIRDNNSYLMISPFSLLDDKLYQLKVFFCEYGGTKKLKDVQEIIYQTIGGPVLKNSKGVERLLFQSLLFISVICLYKDNKSIEDLLNTKYRPAMLLFGNTEPASDLEKEFVSINEIGKKIHFLIKNILEI